MAKIIIEVSDEYIRESADVEKLQKKFGEKENGILKALFGMIAFKGVVKKLDEGVNEFTINQETLSDKGKELFENSIMEICLLTHVDEK